MWNGGGGGGGGDGGGGGGERVVLLYNEYSFPTLWGSLMRAGKIKLN